MITKKYSMLVSSVPANGARNKNAFGNRFDVVLDGPLNIPKECYNPRLELVSASVWNSASNISPSFNNNTLNLVLGGTSLNITFPSGLYSLSAINAYINNELVSNGYASNRILFDPNYATSQVGLYMTVVGDVVDMSPINSIGSILGFNHDIYTCTIPNTYIYSENKAQLNRVNEFLISVSLLNGKGIPLNNINNNILSNIPITSGPNELIVYTPSILVSVDLEHLKGQTVNNFSVALLDQELRDVDLNQEQFQMVMTFSFELKVY